MHVLEARFRPQQGRDDAFIVVAHLVWDRTDRDTPQSVRPAASLGESTSAATMLAKLHFLVARSAPESFTRLQTLKSQFWSFVDVTGR